MFGADFIPKWVPVNLILITAIFLKNLTHLNQESLRYRFVIG